MSRRKHRRVRVEDEQGIRPTRETVRKRRYDTLGFLWKRGRITTLQRDNASRIREAIEIITADVRYRPPSYEDQGGVPDKSGRPPTDHSTPREAELQLNYSNWLSELTRQRITAGPVLDMIIDELPVAYVEQKWRLDRGEAMQRLRGSLDIYQWVRVRFRDIIAV